MSKLVFDEFSYDSLLLRFTNDILSW